MSASKKSVWLRAIVALGIVAVTAGTARAALPSTVSYRVKKITTALDQAEKALDAGHKMTAQRKLVEAQRAMKEIMSRYAGKFSTDDPEYKAAADRLTALTAKIQGDQAPAGNDTPAPTTDDGKADAPAQAVAGEKLPSAVASGVRKINASLDQVDKSLEADRLTTAQRKLGEAQKALKQVNDRYAGKFSADHPDFKAATDRLAAMTQKVDAATKTAAADDEAQKKAQAENDALCRQWIDKLSPFTDRASDQYLRIGSDFNGASPENQAKSRAAYPKAKALFEEYQKVQFPLGKTRELKNVESRLGDLVKEYGRDEAEAAQQAACKEWTDKLAPFVEAGMNNNRYLIAAPTANAEQIKTRQALYAEAKKLFADYQKAEFPTGKTQRLQGLEEKLAATLEEFPKAMADSRAMISGDVGKRLDGVLAYLNRDTSWKDDAKKKPPTVMARDLTPLQDAVTEYASTAAAGDAKLADLKAKLAAIKAKDAEHRAIRAKRTFQKADGFSGSDIDALKAKATSVAAAAYPKGRVLRVTVPSANWAIEDVVEHTDTTRTAVRRRITRSVRSQVAVKDAAGAVWLQEVYLGQDKLPDGGWAALKGHTTWADRMAAENVGKTGP